MNLTTFATALSGLNANAQGLSVVGNNLANLNTVGFKSSDISFTDVLGEVYASGAGGSGKLNLGLGTQVGSVRANFSGGTVQTTNNPLDVAIQGKGMLVLDGPQGRYYSRAGNLHLDSDNNLVAENGMGVQGYMRNPATGLIDGNSALETIKMPAGVETPVKTSQFELTMNLDASAPTGTPFSTSVQIYDSLGSSHMAKMTLQKDITAGTPPVTNWKFDITIPEKDIAGADPASTNQYSLLTGAVASATPDGGTLVFDDTGKLTSVYTGAAPGTLPALANLTIPPTGVTMPGMANGASLNSDLTWKLTDGNGVSPVTAFASPSDVTFSSQNGMAAGTLNTMSIQPDGTISASFTNGKTVNFGQVVLAQFANIDGLSPAGGGVYQETAASGASFVGAPGDSGRGRLIGGALEQSNVDLASELTKIITYQRAYQANSKLITTTNEILQQTMQMMQ